MKTIELNEVLKIIQGEFDVEKAIEKIAETEEQKMKARARKLALVNLYTIFETIRDTEEGELD